MFFVTEACGDSQDRLERATETKQQVGFTMTSNLTLLTEDMAEFLAREKFHVMVSIDGDRESHDRHRVTVSGEGTYDTTVANLKLLVGKMRLHGTRLPKIRATMTAGNVDPVATEEHLRSLGTHLVEVGESHGTVNEQQDYDVGSKCEERMNSFNARIDSIIEQLEADPSVLPDVGNSLRKSLRKVHDEVTRKQAYSQARPTLCGVCRNMKAVTPEGDLFPCHRYVGMEAFKMGNIHTGGIQQDRVRDYYDALYTTYAEKCAPCWLRHLCGGQCPWYLSSEDGAISPPDDATCDDIRDGFEVLLGFYATLMSRFPEALASILGRPIPVEGKE